MKPKINHAAAAADFLSDEARADWHNRAVWHLRKKRDTGISSVSAWEILRELASGIKAHTLSHLDFYLEQFEANAQKNGVTVHWANDAEAHNRIVLSILQKHGIAKIVKSKSMLTEECHLNPYLEAQGIEVVDTDLGERIIQWRQEPPSHIVAPAIHIRREEVGELFHEKLGTGAGVSDPQYLTEAARGHLRRQFIESGAAITGVNFAVAESGGVVVVTNEGNADMGVHLNLVQIHCLGIEKVIPRVEDLGVFLRLLARSATGQPISVYTSHHLRPKVGGEMHYVIVDNGRSVHLGRPRFRDALKCIRCGACMNTCPVYRRSGGYSYGSTIPGPIGSVLMPGVSLEKHDGLPFASTLCGSCTDVCPVKIDLHEQLYRWRQVIVEELPIPATKSVSIHIIARVLANSSAYRLAGKLTRLAIRFLPGVVQVAVFRAWTKGRELPQLPRETFKDWYRKNRKD